MARVGSYSSRGYAELAAGMLDARGIPARVSADDAGGMAPQFALGAYGFAVEVPDLRAAEAQELLDAVEADRPPRRTGWRRTVVRVYSAAMLILLVVGLAYIATH